MKRPESATDPGARRLILLAGGQARGEAWVAGQLAAVDRAAILWIADTAPTGIQATPVGRVSRCLGGESRLLVFNAHQGFHPDAFAAAAGTLRGGGDCVVLVPPLESWPAYADPDKARFACYPRGLDDMRGLFVERLLRLCQYVVGVHGFRVTCAVPDNVVRVVNLHDNDREVVPTVVRPPRQNFLSRRDSPELSVPVRAGCK